VLIQGGDCFLQLLPCLLIVLLLQEVTDLLQVVPQIMHILQRKNDMSFHGRIEVLPPAARPKLRQAGIGIELGLMEAIEANAVLDEKLFQVRKFASAGIVVVQLQNVGPIDIGADLLQFRGAARRKMSFAPVERQLFLADRSTKILE
jgi:hypothetical protein